MRPSSIDLKNYRVILASASQARRKLLTELNIPFSVCPTQVEEVYPSHLKREEITDYLSELKSMSLPINENEIIITADTIVWLEEKMSGKPQTEKEAFTMLQSLSGRTHEVITSVCIRSLLGKERFSDVTQVHFRPLTEDEIHYYVENYSPLDKAGAYSIHEWIGHIGISKIQGSHFNVMGLPVYQLYQALIRIINSTPSTDQNRPQ